MSIGGKVNFEGFEVIREKIGNKTIVLVPHSRIRRKAVFDWDTFDLATKNKIESVIKHLEKVMELNKENEGLNNIIENTPLECQKPEELTKPKSFIKRFLHI